MWDEALINTMVLFKKNLEAKPDIGGIIDTVGEIYDGADKLFAELKAKDETVAEGVGKLACQEGCSYCCYRQVAVSGAEAFAIGTYLRLALPDDGIASVSSALTAISEVVVTKSASERAWMKLPCPLLSENLCAVYSIRPLQCRSTCSTSAELCALGLEDGEDPQIEALSAQVDLYKGTLAVLMRVEEEMGFKTGPYDLIPALSIVLDDDTAAPRWLQGEDVLAPARINITVE